MTTTVVYGSTGAGNAEQVLAGTWPAASQAQLYASWPTKAFPTKVQSTSNTGTSDTYSVTLGSTPTSGNLLVAMMGRHQDNKTVTTAPSGWAAVTGTVIAGTARACEIWYKISDGSETGALSFVCSGGGSNDWKIYIAEISASGGFTTGSGIYPFGSGGGATATTFNATVPFDQLGINGPMFTIAVERAVSDTVSSVSSYDTTNQRYTDLSSSGIAAASYCGRYNNSSGATQTIGQTVTWTASVQYSWAYAIFSGAGRYLYDGTNTTMEAGLSYTSPTAATMAQAVIGYDCSAVPDGDTVSSVTHYVAGSGADASPSAALEVWYLGTTNPINHGYDDSMWGGVGSSYYSGKTKCATYAAASTFASGSYNTLTSESGFPGIINKTGSIYLLYATDDQRTETSRTANNKYAMVTPADTGSLDPYLSIVSSGGTEFQGWGIPI